MSTRTLTGDSFGSSLRETARVPLSRLVHVELRKLIDTRAGRWLLVAIAGLTVAAVVLFLGFGPEDQLTYPNFLGLTATPQGFLLPVVGILSVTSEWSQRTGLVTFTLEPHRGRVLLAKMAAVLLLGLLGGLAFGLVLLSSAAAIVLSFVLPLAAGLLFSLVPALADSAPWIDINTAQAPLFDFANDVTAEEWLQLLVTSLWWVWIPLAAGIVRVLRTEVKSA